MAQSLEIDPFDPEGDASRRDTLGLIRLRQGRVEEAIELFEGALARMPAEAPYRIATLEPLHEALQAAGREARAAEIAAELAETRLRDEKAIASLGLDDGIFVSEEFNFRLEDPPAGWHDLDVSAVNPAAIVGLRRSGPEVFFTIVPTVQEVPGVSLESLGRALRVSLESRTHELYLASEERRTLAGMDGWLIEASGRRDDHRFDWLLWVTVQNGVTYQFLLWAQEGRLARSALRTDLEAFAGRFSLLDPARHFGPVVEYLAALESDRFGFRLPLAEGRWVAWNDLPEQADAGAMAGSDAALIVASVSYLGRSVAPREAAEALLAVFDHELPAGAVRTSEADVSEFRFDAERPMEGDLFEYRVRVLASSSAAWLAMAWKRKGTDPGVLEAVDGFDVSPASLTVRSEADLAPSDRARHAAFFNVVGVSRFARGQGGGAIEDLRLSATLAPEAQTLENLTHVLLAAGRSAEAAEILAAHTEAVEARPQLRAYRALARGRAGETEAAIEEYRTAFDAGYESDEFFEDYVQLVWASGDEAGALTALDDEIARTRSVRLRRLRAVFRQREGEADAAIEELAALAAASPGDIEGLYLLVNASLDAGRYSEALEVFDRIEAIEGRTNAGQRGRASALLGLGRYREAKEALEVAVALEPASAETREELDQVAAMLGTGSNLALKTPIDPVPERPGAPSPHELPASALDGAGAYWTLRSVAVAYRPGVEHRRTVREIVRIVDPTGVDTMSTLRIGFHPLAEEVFVNLLEVRDAAGEPVARGDVSEFYVLDDVSDMATSDKVAHLPVPGLAPGRTIHLTYTVRSRVAPEQFPLLEETFSRTLPVARAEVFVRADPAALRWTASPDVREERFEGGVAWSVDRPPAYRWEPFQTSYRSFLPWLLVGERASSWSREGAGYLQDIAERLEPDASLAAVARREIAGAQTADEKARRLDAFARRHLTYQAIEFGQRARVPNAVPDILERRYGDCKDHALLLHQLLGHVGVRSHLTLVNLTAPIVESVPSLDQFDHMIVHCSDCTQSRFLDPTNKHWSASDESPLYLAGRAGLVLDEEEPRLVRLAGYRAEHHFVETERELTPDGKGNAVVRERVRMGGYAAALLRGLLSGIEPPSWKEAIQSAYLRGIGSLTLQHLRVEGLNESSGPLELEMGYEIDRAFHRMDRGWVGRIPAPWERAFLGAESVDERLAPFEFEFPVSLRSRIQIAGGRPATLFGEREASGDGPFGRWRATVRESGAIEVHWELERAEGRYPASEYRAFVEEANRSLAAVSRSIRLEAEVSAR